ncbi:hypothetical protein P7C70_g9369, partial [Phenoliferia sp. Uapishka_3]
MRSSFYFLPFTQKCFETPDGTPLPVDFFDTKSWSDLNISPVARYLEEDGMEGERREEREDAQVAEDRVGGLGPAMGEGMTLGDSEAGVEERDGEVPFPEQSGQGRKSVEISRKSLDMSRKEGKDTVEEGKKDDAQIAEYLQRTLRRVETFHAELSSLYDPALAHLYPPLCILTSQRTPTVRGVITPSYSAIPDNPYDQLLFAAGDGIVLFDSAKELPGGEDRWMKHLTAVEESVHGHVSLLGDLDAVRRCLVRLYG